VAAHRTQALAGQGHEPCRAPGRVEAYMLQKLVMAFFGLSVPTVLWTLLMPSVPWLVSTGSGLVYDAIMFMAPDLAVRRQAREVQPRPVGRADVSRRADRRPRARRHCCDRPPRRHPGRAHPRQSRRQGRIAPRTATRPSADAGQVAHRNDDRPRRPVRAGLSHPARVPRLRPNCRRLIWPEGGPLHEPTRHRLLACTAHRLARKGERPRQPTTLTSSTSAIIAG
jgi:hypothetical protein